MKIIGTIILILSFVPALAQERWTFDGAIRNNSLAVSPDESIAVVSNSDSNTVIVYNLNNETVKTTLPNFVTPRNIIFSPMGDKLYISDSSLGTVSVVETALFKTIQQVPVGYGAFGTTLNKKGTLLYVNNQAANTVTVVDMEAGHPNSVITGFAQPRQGVKISPDGETLYVTNFLGDKITIVSTKTNTIVGEIQGFNKIRAISITADGKTLFAANSGSNSIAVVSLDTGKITHTIPVGKDPYGAALMPNGTTLYTGNLGDNSLSVISLPSMKVVGTIAGFNEPRQAIVFSKDQTKAYVLNADLSIAVVDLGQQKIIKTIKSH